MISPICDRCEADINEPGALVFSPPDGVAMTRKFHLCVDCWPLVLGFING